MDKQPGRYSRRTFIAISAQGALALTLAGCGAGSGGAPDGGTAAPLIVEPPPYLLADSEVHLDPNGVPYTLHRQSNAVGGVRWVAPAERLNSPSGVAFAPDGSEVYVANNGNHTVLVLDANGNVLREFGGWGGDPGQYRYVRDIAVGPDGLLYVADAHNHRVQVVEPDGTVVRTIGTPGVGPEDLNSPRAVELDGRGDIHVVDAGNRVQVYDPAGYHVLTYGAGRPEEGGVVMPTDVVFDSWDRAYVCDVAQDRVAAFDGRGAVPLGSFAPQDALGAGVRPRSVTSDGADGLHIRSA